MTDLDHALLDAHAKGDGTVLAELYAQAAANSKDVDAACFYLTHAYVFALESNHANTENLRLQLVKAGREPA